MEKDRIWRWFIGLALLTALLPGLGVVILMVAAELLGHVPGLWVLAATQSHAVALTMGWGGATILGVAIHFLPRLRGVPVRQPQLLKLFLVLFGLGLAVRTVLQPLWALAIEGGTDPLNPWFNCAVAASILAQALGVCGLIAILIATFRAGRPLAKNQGFRQIVSLLAVSGGAMILAQVCWSIAAIRALQHGRSLVVVAQPFHGLAVDLLLFACVPAIGIAMASRLFPLTFRTRPPAETALHGAASLLFLAGTLSVISKVQIAEETATLMSTTAAICYALAWLCGAFAVRIFHPRKPILRSQIRYRIGEDPASIGVLSSFAWLVLAALFLIATVVASRFSVLSPYFANANLVRHACGLGFMTLLIISVGWKMLPGFGGGQSRRASWIWAAVALAHFATFLRILPLLWPHASLGGLSLRSGMLTSAGICATAAILAFVGALAASLRKSNA